MSLSKIVFVLLALGWGNKAFQPIKLTKTPKIEAIEQDFHEPVVTICRHEGTKLVFNLDFGDFNTSDIQVKRVAGEVEIEPWDEEIHSYLFNPKTEEFALQVWVKSDLLEDVLIPTIAGKIAPINADGSYQTEGAVWKSLLSTVESKEGYSLIIPSLKLYSRSCE